MEKDIPFFPIRDYQLHNLGRSLNFQSVCPSFFYSCLSPANYKGLMKEINDEIEEYNKIEVQIWLIDGSSTQPLDQRCIQTPFWGEGEGKRGGFLGCFNF